MAFLAMTGCDGRSTYAASCNEPREGWIRSPDGWHNVPRNEVAIARDGALYWNGGEVSRPILQANLAVVPRLNPYPATVLRIDAEAQCSIVKAVREEMDKALTCRTSYRCGEGDGPWDVGPPALRDSPELRAQERKADALAGNAAWKGQ